MKKIDTYRNLHKPGCIWSIRSRDRETRGRVIAYAPIVVVDNAKFVVQPAGRARVLRDKKKYVHAFVRGDWRSEGCEAEWTSWFKEQQVYCNVAHYNPYKHGSFVDRLDDPNPIEYINHWRAVCWNGRVYLVDSFARSLALISDQAWLNYEVSESWKFKVS